MSTMVMSECYEVVHYGAISALTCDHDFSLLAEKNGNAKPCNVVLVSLSRLVEDLISLVSDLFKTSKI